MTDEPRLFFFDLHRRVEEVFEEVVYRRWPSSATPDWRPPVDIHETQDAYRVEIDLPGVAPDEVRLAANERSLAVSGQRVAPPPEGVRSCRLERSRGRFRRLIEFPEPIDPARCQAEYRLGTFTVVLPKAVSPATAPAGASIELVVERRRD